MEQSIGRERPKALISDVKSIIGDGIDFELDLEATNRPYHEFQGSAEAVTVQVIDRILSSSREAMMVIITALQPMLFRQVSAFNTRRRQYEAYLREHEYQEDEISIVMRQFLLESAKELAVLYFLEEEVFPRFITSAQMHLENKN